jgi:hypothetical protein
LVLDRSAFREVAADPYMTGPALLIMLLGLAVAMIFSPSGWSLPGYPLVVAGRLLGLLLLVVAAHPLGGKGSYTRTLRAVGFGAMANFLALLAVFPFLKPLAPILALVVAFFATWIGASEAQDLRGWRSLVLPVVALVVLLIAIVAVPVLFAGASITFQTLARELGLTP